MAWLSGWAKRVKLTADSGVIDADLTNFPALLKNLMGRLVFLELKNGAKLKGDIKKVENGVIELHSLRNIHYVEVSAIKHVAIAKEGTL